MGKLFLLTFLSISCYVKAQYSQLNLTINSEEIDSSYTVVIVSGIDTVFTSAVKPDSELFLDSLEPGSCRLIVYHTPSPKDDYIVRRVLLKKDKITNISLQQLLDIEYNEFNPVSREEIIKEKGEQQFTFSYFNNDWADKASPVKTNISVGNTVFYWRAFSEHVGFLAGLGLNLSQHYFAKDTAGAYRGYKKNLERYTYFKTNFEVKLRFTSGNQQSSKEFSSKLFADIGIGYYLPIAFRHVVNYGGDLKFIDRNMHNFRDCRAFINVGYDPCSVFFEYRLSDFVFGKFPQLPVYNAGIRLMFGAY